MKNLFFISFLVLISLSLLAQKATNQMIIGNRILETSVEKVTDGYKYSFKQSDQPDRLPSYNAIVFNRDILLAFTLSAFNHINGMAMKSDTAQIEDMINFKFIELVAILFNEDADGPMIATLELKDKIPVYTIDTDVPTHNLIPGNCYVVFKDGFIEQIKVYGKVVESKQENSTSVLEKYTQKQEGENNFKIMDGENYGFSSMFSIGISSLTNKKHLHKTRLYIDNSKKGDAGHIIVGQAIDYVSIPRYGTRDYSPKNGEVELVKGQKINLFKTPNEKLLEFKIFTDMVGFGEQNPNGLIQLELEKRVPINTTRLQLPFGIRAGNSFFSFVDFEFTLSKIENKVKYLQLDTYIPQQKDTTEYYLDALQVYRYQIFQLGGKLNMYLLESHPYKFDFEINLHGNFGYARVIDTISYQDEEVNIDEPLNSFMFSPEIKIIFYPEKRLNLSISGKLTRQFFLYSDDKFGYKSQKDNELIEGSKWFNTIGLDAYYWPSDQGKIFIRYRFNHELNNIYSNFSQFQIGYSMYINTSKKNN